MKFLDDYIKTHSDGEWEHSCGVKLESLDNPGWWIEIDYPPNQGPFYETFIKHRGPDGECIMEATANSEKIIGTCEIERLNELLYQIEKWMREKGLLRKH